MFHFKQFDIDDADCGMKIGTDSVLLGAWVDVSCSTGTPSVLDVGCGSGLLALMMAQRVPDADITGVEIDTHAAETASRNFAASPWSHRIHAVCSDAFSFGEKGVYDIIVCNPPYFSTGLLSPDSSRATARHSGPGLSPITVLDIVSRLLSPEGTFAMVTPADNVDDITFEAEMRRLKITRLCHISTVCGKKPARLLWQLARPASLPPSHQIVSNLSIRDATGCYTPEYIELTSQFYLKL